MEAWQQVGDDEVLYNGYRKLAGRTFVSPSGKEVTFELKKDPHAACIVAITPDLKVIMTREFRPGPNAVFLELPGGVLEESEDPREGADRELLEETGYRGILQEVGTTYVCAYSTAVTHIFLATDCELVTKQNLDENEHIEIVLLSIPEFKEYLRSGQGTDIGAGYIALEALNLAV